MRPIALDKLKNNLLSSYDVFIASASYEERAFSIFKNISEINFRHKYVTASVYYRPFVEKCLNDFITNHQFKGIDVDSTNQISTVNNYLTVLNEILKENPRAKFLIDITTFTRQNLLILFRLLRNVSQNSNVIHCVYARAAEYSVGLPEKEKWLSQGVLNVNSVFGYAGTISPTKRHHLIIMMGFEVERASALINAYEPSRITIGYATKESSYNDDNYNLNKQRFQQLKSEFSNAEEFEFNCSDVDDCKNEVLKQVAKYPEHNVVVSPMHSKMSTLALAIAAFVNKRIQIAIAIPAIYNYSGYSKAGNNALFFDFTKLLHEKSSFPV